MKIERVFIPDAGELPGPASARDTDGWALPATVALVAATLLLSAYWHTVQDMMRTWEINATYAHGFVILPISAWLVWRQRHALAALRPRPELRVLPLLLLPGIAWLLGDLAAVKAVQQFALVSSLPLLVWAVLGRPVFRALVFPLAFLFFAVPFGEFLVPVLMQYTADFTVIALRLTGVPVYREGLLFSTPGGNWSVVEACSGLRYLIACLTGGVLYGYLRYRSFKRRAIFVVLSAVVPIIANGVRAYLIVMIDYVSGGRIAADIDHVLYGWVFFCMVTLLLFWVGSLWREDDIETVRPLARPAAARGASPAAFVGAGAAAAIAMAAWPAIAAMLETGGAPEAPVLAAPAHAGKWRQQPDRMTGWEPRFQTPSAVLEQSYTDGARWAGLYVGYYSNQRRNAELVSSLNVLAGAHEAWQVTSEAQRTERLAHRSLSVVESRLQGPRRHLLVWQWYWVDGIHTPSAYWAKLLQLRAQLLGRGDDGAVILLYTEDDGRRDAAAELADFADAVLPTVTGSLYHAR